jgi:hypothetical protein
VASKGARRQHVVSNFYLKEFSDEANLVSRMVLPGIDRKVMATNNAAVVKDFYTLTLPDGTASDAFEQMLGKIENGAARSLRAVVHGGVWPIAGEQRQMLAAWIALQYLRSEAIRDSHTETKAQMIRLAVGISGKEALRQLISRCEGRSVDDHELNFEWDDITKPSGPDLTGDPSVHVHTLLRLWVPTSARLVDSPWTLFRFNRRCLATSDNPVFLSKSVDHPEQLGVGVANAAGFTVPLSRRVGLVIGPRDSRHPDMQIPGSTVWAKLFIDGVAHNARRYLYHHPSDDPFAGINLPDQRLAQMGTIDDSWIQEKGILASVIRKRNFSRGTAPGDVSRRDGFDIDDIPWPIPGRRYRKS